MAFDPSHTYRGRTGLVNKHKTQESSLSYYKLLVLHWRNSLWKHAPTPCLEERDEIAFPLSIELRKTTLNTLHLWTLMRKDKRKPIFRILMLVQLRLTSTGVLNWDHLQLQHLDHSFTGVQDLGDCFGLRPLL